MPGRDLWRGEFMGLTYSPLADRYESKRMTVRANAYHGLLGTLVKIGYPAWGAVRLLDDEGFWTLAMAGAGLIDVEHVPAESGLSRPPPGGTRPRPHSLASVAALAAVATCSSGRRRSLVAGAAFGVLTHLLRDLATGDAGVPLAWPL